MRGRAILAAGTAAFVLIVVGHAAAARAGSDEAGVRRALQHYLDGHATGDPAVMSRAFHPEAELKFIRDGAYAMRTLEEYLAGMSGKPAEDEAQQRRRILSVDIAGNAALGKIELESPRARIIDYMTLLEVNGEWKIVHKSFFVEPKEG